MYIGVTETRGINYQAKSKDEPMASKKNKSKAVKLNEESVLPKSILEGDGGMPTVEESVAPKSDENTSNTITNNDNARESNKGDAKVVHGENRKDKDAQKKSDWPIDRHNIKVIRERTSLFIVFVDDKGDVRWLWNDSGAAPLSDDARNAMSQTRLLASTPVTYLDENQKKSWNHMIGESLALALSEDVKNALATFKKTQEFLLARAKETARIWFVQGSLYAFVPMLLVGISLYFLSSNYPEHKWFHEPIAQAIVFGSIGAQFSMLLRLSNLDVDPGAGKKAHYGEAIIRILLGVFAGVIAVVAVKADLIFGFIDFKPISAENKLPGGTESWWVPAIALLAGASERFIPTFLHQMETQAFTQGQNASEGNVTQQSASTDKEGKVDPQEAFSKDKQISNHDK